MYWQTGIHEVRMPMAVGFGEAEYPAGFVYDRRRLAAFSSPE